MVRAIINSVAGRERDGLRVKYTSPHPQVWRCPALWTALWTASDIRASRVVCKQAHSRRQEQQRKRGGRGTRPWGAPRMCVYDITGVCSNGGGRPLIDIQRRVEAEEEEEEGRQGGGR